MLSYGVFNILKLCYLNTVQEIFYHSTTPELFIDTHTNVNTQAYKYAHICRGSIYTYVYIAYDLIDQ